MRESSKNDLENIEGRVAEAHDLMAKVNLELGEEKERRQKVDFRKLMTALQGLACSTDGDEVVQLEITLFLKRS